MLKLIYSAAQPPALLSWTPAYLLHQTRFPYDLGEGEGAIGQGSTILASCHPSKSLFPFCISVQKTTNYASKTCSSMNKEPPSLDHGMPTTWLISLKNDCNSTYLPLIPAWERQTHLLRCSEYLVRMVSYRTRGSILEHTLILNRVSLLTWTTSSATKLQRFILSLMP